MTVQEEPRPTNATQNTITAINSTESLSRLVHEMAHTCLTIEEFFERLAGLLQVFWGENIPNGGKLNEIIWLHVVVETMPPECMLPLFENSMAKLEGRKLEERKKHKEGDTENAEEK